LRTALCAYSFREALKSQKMTYQDLVRLAVETGIDGLDLTVYWFPSTGDDFLLPLKRLAFRSAVEIYSISVRTEMTQATPELQAKEVAEIQRWVDVAERLGAGHIRVFGGRVPKGATEEQAAGWAAEVLKRSAEYAAAKGVILGLENHGGVTEKAATIIGIIKQVGSPWVGINLDTGNFRQDPWRQIEMCLPYAVNFQVKSEMAGEDGKRQPSDWDRLLQMAAAAGYQGYLALEYEAKEDPATAAPRLLGELRRLARKYSG
jgi:sugar phosphate isomerase/epimerase